MNVVTTRNSVVDAHDHRFHSMALGILTTGYFLPVMGVTLYVGEGTGSYIEGD